MLRILFILVCAVGIMFVLDATMAQNANAQGCAEGEHLECTDSDGCGITPTCACAYGGRAQNHLKLTDCNVNDEPTDPVDDQPVFEADCNDDKETGVVIPPDCTVTCECVPDVV